MDARACGLLVQCMWFAFAQFSSFQFSEWAMGTAGGRIFAHKSYIFFNLLWAQKEILDYIDPYSKTRSH